MFYRTDRSDWEKKNTNCTFQKALVGMWEKPDA